MSPHPPRGKLPPVARLGKKFALSVPNEAVREFHGTKWELVRVDDSSFKDESWVLANLSGDDRVNDTLEELAVHAEILERRDAQHQA